MKGKHFKKFGKKILKRVTSALLVVVMLFTMMGIYIPAETFKASEDSFKIYFANSLNWSQIRAHVWIEGGNGTTWPGMEVEFDSSKNLYVWDSANWSEDISSGFGIIFNNNNNGAQTDNIYITQEDHISVANEWLVTWDGTTHGLYPCKQVTLNLRNDWGWSNCNVYAWQTVNGAEIRNASWPGAEVTDSALDDNVFTTTVDYYEIGDLNFIFNSNNSQTGDLSISNDDLKQQTEWWITPAGEVYDPNVPEYDSPVVEGNQVTFNYYSATASNVFLAGSMNGWSTTATKMTESNNLFTVILSDLEPGAYEYKFVADGEWKVDPKNTTEGSSDNCKFVIAGFQGAKAEVKKGAEYTLPTTLNYVQSSGTTSAVEVSYALKETYEEGLVTFVDGKITVDPVFSDSSVVLEVSATVDGKTVTGDYTINLVNKIFTYTIYAHSAVEERNSADAMGLWIWDKTGQTSLKDKELEFEEVTLNGQTWLKTSIPTTAYKNIGMLLKSKGEGVWNWQTADMFYSNPSQTENVDIYLVDGYPTVYTSLDKVPQDRYVYVEYTREDSKYTDTNVYAWNTGYVGKEKIDGQDKEVNYCYDFENVNGKYIAKIPVVVGSSDKIVGFLVRTGYNTGDDWSACVKDGGDNFVTIPADQDYVKVRFEGGKISYVLPAYEGGEINRKNNTITFYYRDEERFLNNTLADLGKVELVLRTKTGSTLSSEYVYEMEYDAVNERYFYAFPLTEDTDYYYYYRVNDGKVLDSTSTRTEIIDEVEYSLRRNKTYNVNVLLDVTNDDMIQNGNREMDYEDNAVVSVAWEPKTENDTVEGFYVEKAYADLSALGLGTKVEIDPEVMELSFGCLDSISAGEKTIKVTIIDDCGMSYTGETTVTVVERNKTANTADKLGDFDWDEAVIYFAITDRFFDGDETNNPTYEVTSEDDGSIYHGGDLAGLTEKIDYLYKLGVNTIWITPIVDNIDQNVLDETDKNESYGYHGYWASDFTKLNPHLGDEEDLKALIDAAHAKGMKIMVDVVLNHAGYGTEDYFNKIIPVEGAVDADNNQIYQEMIRGTGNTIAGDDKLDSLSGLPDFVTEDEEVRAKLIEWQTTWMTNFGIDYYRVDTVKHVEDTTWVEFKNELTKINSEFKLIGEYYDAGTYNDFDQLDSGKMDSILDFNFNDILFNLADENLAAIEDALSYRNILLSNTATMGSFLSSHDEDGFLYSLINGYNESEDWAAQLMKVAATYQITAKGQPVIYYGEELGLTGNKEYPAVTNRYDFDWTEQLAQESDADSMYNHYKTMLNIRRDYSEVFAKGERYSVVYPNVQKTHLNYTPQGYSVFARGYEDTTLYIGTNVWGKDKTVTFYVEGEVGSKYTDLYNPDKTYTVAADGSITITIPGLDNGNGTAVLVRTSGEKAEVEDTNTITLKLHYNRTKDDYDNGTADTSDDWNAWVWGEGIETEGFKFVEENGEMVATITINNARSTSFASFRMRMGDWKANDHDAKDQSIDLSNVVSGTVHFYVEQGVWGGTTVLGSDAIVGTKIITAKYDRNTNSAVITTNRPIKGDVTSAFNFICNSDDNELTVSQVTEDGCVYKVEFEEDITDMLEVIKSYTVVFGKHEYTLIMPNIYTTEEFENTYTYDGDDLGLTYDKEAGEFTFKVWAPTAENVTLNIYKTGTKGDNTGKQSFQMTKAEKGVWEYTLSDEYHGYYYTYTVDVLNEQNEVCDPYARTTGVNGNRAMILDLDATDPEGWDADAKLNLHKDMEYTDAIIYELHVRDLSIHESSGVKDAYKGKFLGLTQTGTTTENGTPTALDHMIDLGVTHLHLLPIYDYASVDETKLDEPQFNWGYDPLNYNVPEGSYSTDPYNGEVRVKEMKEMIMALHENNINVVMDVVYNHVYDAGSFSINQIVPNYFSRTNADGSFSNGSGCGNDTATERDMVHKFVVESILYWHEEYHIDGFRFDLVGLLDTVTINKIVEEVHKIDPDIIFYGEGWTLGTSLSEEKKDYIMATQQNAWATPNFAYFSDTLRNGVAGSDIDGKGFIWQKADKDGTIMDCFIGNPSWCPDPLQTINYASCHDNYTLMDKINVVSGVDYSNGYDYTPGEYQVKLNNLAASVYMLSQGIPLIHAGEDFLRIKLDEQNTVIHNSYNASDYVNQLRWYNLDEEIYKDTFEYYKGLIEFRKNHKALRLTTDAEVSKVVTSHKSADNLLTFKLDGTKVEGEVADEIIIIYNASNEDKYVDIRSDVGATDGAWKICINADDAGTEVLGTINVSANYSWPKVEAHSTLVLVKGETVDTNSVYALNNNVTITLDQSALTLKEGTAAELTATVNPANSTLIWTSSNKNVATVENGVITAVAPGTTTITVSTLHGVTATCTVTVMEKQRVTLDKTFVELKEGTTTTLTATATPSGTTVTWDVEDDTIVTVVNGVVTAVRPGTTTVYVETPEGAKAECTVTVLEKEDVELEESVITLKEGTNTILSVIASDGAVLTWESDDDTIASVDQTGKVIALKAGEATITVTTQDGLFATCVVTVTHDLVRIDEKEETCTANGNVAYYECQECEKLFLDADGKNVTTPEAVVIPATGHNLTKVTGKDATCTTTGIKEHYKCNTCGVLFSDAEGKNITTEEALVIPAEGHKLTKENGVEASCTEAGLKEHYKCNACGVLFSDAEGKNITTEEALVIPAKGHDEVKVGATVATCTTDGNIEHYKCNTCGKLYAEEACETELKEKDVVIAAGHKTTKVDKVEATCTTDGNIEHYKCNTCDKLFTNEAGTVEITESVVISALGHNLTKVEAKDATCTEAGVKTHYTCSHCSKLFTDAEGKNTTTAEALVIPATGHSLAKVTGKEASCTEAGLKEHYKCNVCGILFTDAEGKNTITEEALVIPATGHDLTKVEAKAPTIETTGNKEYYVCGNCDKLFLDEECIQETTLEDVTIDKLQPEVPPVNPEQPELEKEDVVYVPEEEIHEQVKGEATGLVDKITDSETTTDVVEEGIISEETLDKVQQAIEDEEEIITELVIENKKHDDVEETAKELVESTLNKVMEGTESIIAQYLDIKIVLKTEESNEELGTLNKLSEEITLTFEIPDEWKKEGRKFHVIRVHEGKTDVLDVWENEDGTVSFKTDRFSTYALVYTDADIEDEIVTTPPTTPEEPAKPSVPTAPQTGDNSMPGVYFLVLLAGFAVAMAGVANKRKYVK